MTRTSRQADQYTEWKIRIGEQTHWDYTNTRVVINMRKKTRSYYSDTLDPLSMKVTSWREYGKGLKACAKRKARHNAKLMFNLMVRIQEDVEPEEIIYERYYDDALEYMEDRLNQEMEEHFWGDYETYWGEEFDYGY